MKKFIVASVICAMSLTAMLGSGVAINTLNATSFDNSNSTISRHKDNSKENFVKLKETTEKNSKDQIQTNSKELYSNKTNISPLGESLTADQLYPDNYNSQNYNMYNNFRYGGLTGMNNPYANGYGYGGLGYDMNGYGYNGLFGNWRQNYNLNTYNLPTYTPTRSNLNTYKKTNNNAELSEKKLDEQSEENTDNNKNTMPIVIYERQVFNDNENTANENELQQNDDIFVYNDYAIQRGLNHLVNSIKNFCFDTEKITTIRQDFVNTKYNIAQKMNTAFDLFSTIKNSNIESSVICSNENLNNKIQNINEKLQTIEDNEENKIGFGMYGFRFPMGSHKNYFELYDTLQSKYETYQQIESDLDSIVSELQNIVEINNLKPDEQTETNDNTQNETMENETKQNEVSDKNNDITIPNETDNNNDTKNITLEKNQNKNDVIQDNNDGIVENNNNKQAEINNNTATETISETDNTTDQNKEIVAQKPEETIFHTQNSKENDNLTLSELVQERKKIIKSKNQFVEEQKVEPSSQKITYKDKFAPNNNPLNK